MSFVLVIIYFILFGLDSLKRLGAGDITITRNEEFLENITSPGNNGINIMDLNIYISTTFSDQY